MGLAGGEAIWPTLEIRFSIFVLLEKNLKSLERETNFEISLDLQAQILESWAITEPMPISCKILTGFRFIASPASTEPAF